MIQHAFSNPSLVNLISKEKNLVLYQFTHCFTLQTSHNDVTFDFCVDSASYSDVIQKVQRHHDPLKAHAVR